MKAILVTAILSAVAIGAQAEDGTLRAFVGARVIPIAGPELADGVLVVRGSTLEAVGPRSATAVPPGAEIVDLAGRVVMPGLVDTHSHIAGVEGADGSAPIQPDIRVLDALDVRDPSVRRARAGGITTVNVMPGSGHLSSGQTLYLKLRDGRTIEDFLILDRDGRIAGGLKMANGTNSRRDPPFPGTRAKSAALVRERFIAALEYRAKLADVGESGGERPARDLGLEALLEVLDGKRVVHHHTHRHDDIATVLRLQDEFGFRVVLHHVSEGWRMAPEIAAAGVPCSIIAVDSPGGKSEARELSFETGGVLERAGVSVSLHSDDWITDSRLLLRSAALLVRGGMSREGALRAVTLEAARQLDLGDRVGSLEPGKYADFVVLSGDPLSIYTRVLETWVEGRRVFNLDDPDDRLAADGGYGAGRGQHAHVECFAQEDER